MFSTIKEAIEDLKNDKMLIVVDDYDRENQGDLIFPAQAITTQKANFLMKEGRGMFCVSLTREYATKLDIPLMIPQDFNTEKLRCNFGITIDAHNVTSHGISAADRALTIKTILDPKSTPNSFLRPGHVSPIIAKDGGVLKRNGHTEASVDLARLAAFAPVSVLTEIINDQGETSKGQELFDFAKKHNLKIITIKDLIDYLTSNPLPELPKQPTITKSSTAHLPTKYGNFTIHIYHSQADNKEHAVLTMGDLTGQPILARIHSQCLTGDTFHSLRCDCHEQLHKSLEIISKNQTGILIYLNQEGRGIGLTNKIKTYALQEKGLDTAEANLKLALPIDGRDYKIAAEILKDQNISSINLLTNNPDKIKQLKKHGITIKNLLPLETIPNKFNKQYLLTKKQKLGHKLTQIK